MKNKTSARLRAVSPFMAAALLSSLLLAGCVSAPPFAYNVPQQPEGASGYTEKPGWATSKFAVAAANPLATDRSRQNFEVRSKHEPRARKPLSQKPDQPCDGEFMHGVWHFFLHEVACNKLTGIVLSLRNPVSD
jgi:hypothetical protein